MEHFFDIDGLRDVLSRKKNLYFFARTYFEKLPEIANRNTSNFWNPQVGRNKRTLLNSPIYKDKINCVFNYLKNKKGKILDIGFGKGLIEEKLVLSGSKLKIYGIDISDFAVEKIKRGIKGKFYIGNILKISFKSSLFNYILVLDVLEHIPTNKIFRAYAEVKRVLVNNGVLLISVPLNEGLQELLNKNKNPNAHVREYTPGILKAELKLSGLKVFKEVYLYAFSNVYIVKKLIMKIFPGLRKPNLLILFAKKK
jgi:2-polyprenyl-3-methyl-5-hydroxy-6-metoxy-1,4-benzoquinol methylase